MMELTASQITKDAILILKTRNCEVWRQTNLTVRNRKGIVTPGVSDIIGYNRGTGIAIFCECKKLGDVLSKAQIEFLFRANDAGCVTLIATEKNRQTVLVDFKEYMQD